MIDDMPNGKRIIPPNDSDLVEEIYNIGIYSSEEDACEIDTERSSHTCLYINYCNGDYCDTILAESSIDAVYNFFCGLFASNISDNPSMDEIESVIEDRLIDEIKGYDRTFKEHMSYKCPAADPDGVDDEEGAAMLWCKYILERGPK